MIFSTKIQSRVRKCRGSILPGTIFFSPQLACPKPTRSAGSAKHAKYTKKRKKIFSFASFRVFRGSSFKLKVLTNSNSPDPLMSPCVEEVVPLQARCNPPQVWGRLSRSRFSVPGEGSTLLKQRAVYPNQDETFLRQGRVFPGQGRTLLNKGMIFPR